MIVAVVEFIDAVFEVVVIVEEVVLEDMKMKNEDGRLASRPCN